MMTWRGKETLQRVQCDGETEGEKEDAVDERSQDFSSVPPI